MTVTKYASLLTILFLSACGAQEESKPGPDLAPLDPAPESTAAEPREPDATLALETEIALGSAVKRLCSSVLVSGRSQQHVMARELSSAVASGLEFSIDGDLVTGHSADPDMQVQALYRPYLGCTLIKNTSVEALRLQYALSDYPQPAPPALDKLWPDGERVDIPSSLPGVDLAAINAAVDQAFVDIEPDQNIDTRAVLVIHKGRIIAEKYAEPFHAQMPQLGWSMTKTVTGALTSMLAAEGLMHIDSPATVSEWQNRNDPRRRITLENLLQMSSGLEYSEVYTAGSMSDVILMLYTTGDTGAFTANKPLAQEPGSTWYYSSGTSNLISRLQRQLFTSHQNYFNYPRERLFKPLAMHSAVLEPDASGTFVGSSYMYATPRDWAKIGLLYLQDGVWNDQRLLPEGWVEFSLTPAPAAPGGNYGAQIWLNAGNADDPDSRPMPQFPPSMYYLSGFEGQNVVMFPEQELIVVRMGVTTRGPRPIWTLAESVLTALSQSQAQ
ncbi:MAG: serine hydrolase [Pseudomonadales bacterium]|nr:serine hydrolase [Pseudomonadales bacterium]